jgi:CHAT domain-containing protein
MNYDEQASGDGITREALHRFLSAGPRPAHEDGFPANSGSVSGVCPERGSYLSLALGRAQHPEAEFLLTHASECPDCGRILAASVQSLEGQPSPEETAAIAKLAAGTVEWQQQMARQLALTKAQPRPGWFGSPARWIAVGSVAAAMLAATALWLMRRDASAPDRQIASAYTESRTQELRIPEAGYAPLSPRSHTRGAGTDREPAVLLEARARLARELGRAPQSAHWLQLQARADLLEEKYDAAADVLDRLIAQGPVTPALLTDDAAAYYQRGLVSGSEGDRSTALDYLMRADELAPTDPVVLFNEAIVMEDRAQMMNAVEVWNRYITVERDPQWLAEGKRKLQALEATLNRLKTHQSRINRMLATPAAMDALANDPVTLASFDEELSSYDLDRLLPVAFPVVEESDRPAGGVSGSSRVETGNAHLARGSPCLDSCRAAGRLLKAIGRSLEIHHHDYWLTDLLSLDIDSLPGPAARRFAEAAGLTATASRENAIGNANEGARMAGESRALFEQLRSTAGSQPGMLTAASTGEQRASVEYLFALQRKADFRECRLFAKHNLNGIYSGRVEAVRYPWMAAQGLATEGICDDTPESRAQGRARGKAALATAKYANYFLIEARIELMLAKNELDSFERESSDRELMASLRRLYKGDVPAIRIANAMASFAEEESPLSHADACFLREAMDWYEVAGSRSHAAIERLHLARAELRLGATGEASEQIRLAREEDGPSASGKASGANFSTEHILFASTMLEQGNLTEASKYLDSAGVELTSTSDTWLLRQYTAERGMLELARGHFRQAAEILDSEIRASEGRSGLGNDAEAETAFAQQDHDLYAELAAAWLAQGRSPDSILALWERFRLRSRNLPIADCRGKALDCDVAELIVARKELGKSLVIGQIVLLDRVLVYRVDELSVTFSNATLGRRHLIDAARQLQRAASSPYTSLETASKLGAEVSDAVLPKLPATLDPGGSILLEADTPLDSLPWPVLPTPSGPLGLQYPIVNAPSILNTMPEAKGSALKFQSALIVGASVGGGGEPPLPDAMREATSVAELLHAPNLLVGDQATANHLATALSSATILHFAGHARQTPDGTELMLAASPGEERPWLDASFLRRHPPRQCRLAVLSACSTGIQESSWNRSLEDIVHTLAAQGTREVVATGWQIDSQASVPFMNVFYQSLARGNTVASALTSARKIQSRNPLYNKPYYWAGYYAASGEFRVTKGRSHDDARNSKEKQRS